MDYWEEKVRRRLNALDGLGGRNAAVCRAFIGYLLASGLSYARASAYIDTFMTFGRYVKKSFEDVSREDVERFFEWMKESGYSESTISSTKWRLKRFYKWLLGEDERYPEQVSWLRPNNVKNRLPREILSIEEVKAMANAAENIRDKALVLTLYESGLRAGEFLDLKIRDVEIDQYGVILRVSGKTGDRRIRIISAAPALLEWLNHHPRKGDPEARVFGRSPDYRRMSYVALRKILRKLGEKAGIRKNIHPHLFRHSRATHLARHLTESQLNQFFGWSQGSRMAQIYVHLSGRDLDPALLRLAGLKSEAEEAEGSRFAIRRCPRCGELNPPNEETCKRCGMILDLEKANQLLMASRRGEDQLEHEIKEIEAKIETLASRLEKLWEVFMKRSELQASS